MIEWLKEKIGQSKDHKGEVLPPLPPDDPYDVDFLMQDGKIEELVTQGRIPLIIAEAYSGGDPTKYYMYQVPPRDYDPSNYVDRYFGDGGAWIFVRRDGREEIGMTYNLTEDQTVEVERRILAVRPDLTPQIEIPA